MAQAGSTKTWRSESPHTTFVLTLKGAAHCANIWSISWILCISGHRDTLGQSEQKKEAAYREKAHRHTMVFKPIDITSTCQGEPQAECWPSLGEGLPIRGWLLSAGGRMSPIQPPLSARQAGCVGRPGSSVADASPHVRGRQWPDGVPL
ncbi:hypothetical protein JOQ06_028259, partial [Pogonophryne albipinna]